METGAAIPESTRRARVVLALGLVLLAIVWFAPAGFRPLSETDEGRYAEIPREMLRSGELITPRLNGFLYFEKPPLQYWATAAAYAVFGLNEFAARFFTALSGLLTIVLVGVAGGRHFGRKAGVASALLLGSSLFFLLLGRVNTLDMGVTFFLTVALVGFLAGQANRDDPRRNRNGMLLCWAGMALAILTKGLMGLVLPGGVLVTYSLLQRDRGVWRRLHLGKGLLLLVLVTGWWFVAVSVKNPSFPRFFFIHEHFERFLTKGHNRYKPPWWFLPVLIGGVLPWIAVVVGPAIRGWRRTAPRGEFDARRLLWVWTAFIFLFFSASSSKLLGYIGPCFPSLALLAGPELARAGRGRLRITAGIAFAFGAALLVGSFFTTTLAPRVAGAGELRGTIPWIVAAGAVLLAGGVLAWIVAGRSRRMLAAGAVAAAFLVGVSLALLASRSLEPSQSSKSFAARIRPHLGPGVAVYAVDIYDQSLPFYLDTTMRLVVKAGELKFGITQEPERWIESFAEFRRMWKEDEKAVAVMFKDRYELLRQRGLPMAVIPGTDDGRRIAVMKP